MSTAVEKTVEEAMSLPAESRAEVADLLVQSLDGAELGHIDQLWLAKAARRLREVRNGDVDPILGPVGGWRDRVSAFNSIVTTW